MRYSLTDQAQEIRALCNLVVVHCGTLRKTNMAAARVLSKVGRFLLESPAARRSGTGSCLAGRGRAYGTGGAGFRSKLLSSTRAGGGRALGCAFLLGGGLGWYQAVKLSVRQQHLAEEETKTPVSPGPRARVARGLYLYEIQKMCVKTAKC